MPVFSKDFLKIHFYLQDYVSFYDGLNLHYVATALAIETNCLSKNGVLGSRPWLLIDLSDLKTSK